MKQNKDYELEYWNYHYNHSTNYVKRMKVIEKVFPRFMDLPSELTVADVGCGPNYGVFVYKKFQTMIAVDPIWNLYFENHIVQEPNVPSVCSLNWMNDSSENFTLENPADAIISINALDHSGDLKQSVDNIMKNLKPNGIFFIHIHMRTKEQLNEGHPVAFSEDLIDDCLMKYKMIRKKLYNVCPFDRKPYRSYIAELTNSR